MATVVQAITGIILPSATFTRPSDTTAYAAGDLMANSTTAASVLPMQWRVGVTTDSKHSFYITGVRLKMSNASITNAQFRVHVYKALPTIATTGDNAVYGTVVSGYANEIGIYDATLVSLHADGATGLAVPSEGAIEPQHITGLDPGSYVVVYGLIEVLAAYTPANAQTVVAELLVELS